MTKYRKNEMEVIHLNNQIRYLKIFRGDNFLLLKYKNER